jgi:hypothetical protein
MRARAVRVVSSLALGLLLAVLAAPSAAQMPDPRMMSGQVMPSGDLPAGTVTVRLIRQTIMNVVPGVDVELHGAGPVRHEKTGPDGHAVFSGVPPGSRVQAVAVVDNERLQSIEFEVPASGGIRTLLAAGVGVGTMLDGSSPVPVPGGAGVAGAAGPAAAPPPAGSLVFGGDTRIAVEFQDDTLTVFYLLDLVNRASTPVAPQAPLTIDLPDGASGVTILEGGSPLAVARGSHVVVSGPLPSGVTQVPIAFRIERWKETWQLEQRFPLPILNVALAVQKLGGMRLVSPQAPTVREATLQGSQFIVATGASLAAGRPLSVTVSGLPHRSDLPVYLTLVLAAGIAGWGVWLAAGARSADPTEASRRRELETRRDRGLAALATLEEERRSDRVEETPYAARRAVLIDQLERVYSELDGNGGVPGGDRGLAA